MALAFSEFGVGDVFLYKAYLSTWIYGESGDAVDERAGVSPGLLRRVGSSSGVRRRCAGATVDVEVVRRLWSVYLNGGSSEGCGGFVGGFLGKSSGVEEKVGRVSDDDGRECVFDGAFPQVGGQTSGVDRVVGGSEFAVVEGAAVASDGFAQANVAVRLCDCGKVDSCKTCANRERRKQKKNVKQRRQFIGCDWRKRESQVRAFPREVDETWIKRKNAENSLREAQAKRQLKLLEARDFEDDRKKQRAKVVEQTERSKVNIEKAYMSLRCTGNVAELPGGGFAETVVSGGTVEGVPGLSPGSGSISPDSSASQHDYRLALKQIADKDKLIEELQLKLKGQDLNEGKALTLTSSVEKFVEGLDDDEYSLDVDPAVFYEGADPEILASVRELKGKIYVSKSRLKTQQESY